MKTLCQSNKAATQGHTAQATKEDKKTEKPEDRKEGCSDMGFTTDTRKKVYEKTNGHCYYCSYKLRLSENDLSGNSNIPLMQIDHFIPKTLGGGNEIDNLFPSCNFCNSVKGDILLASLSPNASNGKPGKPAELELTTFKKLVRNLKEKNKAKDFRQENPAENIRQKMIQGWQCPLCGCIWAPSMPICWKCSPFW